MKKTNKTKVQVKIKKAKLSKAVKMNTAVKVAKKANGAAVKAVKRGRKVLQVDVLDKILLKMAQKPYNKILSQIENGKKRLNEERRLALQLGTRILSKAKKVRDSLMSKPSRS